MNELKNEPLDESAVEGIKAGPEKVFKYTPRNRYWRRGTPKRRGTQSNNRKETKGRQYIKQRIQEKVRIRDVEGNALITMAGKAALMLTGRIKTIFHKRSNPFA